MQTALSQDIRPTFYSLYGLFDKTYQCFLIEFKISPVDTPLECLVFHADKPSRFSLSYGRSLSIDRNINAF